MTPKIEQESDYSRGYRIGFNEGQFEGIQKGRSQTHPEGWRVDEIRASERERCVKALEKKSKSYKRINPFLQQGVDEAIDVIKNLR